MKMTKLYKDFIESEKSGVLVLIICTLISLLIANSAIGEGYLDGIGFTMSIFITLLAFDNETIINNTKFVILISSLIAGIIGFISLRLTLRQPNNENL